MKKALSILLTLCMTLSLFSGLIMVSAADYETVVLNGFNNWAQAELDTSSGNNGYANSCSSALYVETDAKYIVGGGKQSIKAVFGNSGTGYNNCIVNWTYGTGGPCTAGNVWAAADGTSVDVSAYDGVRIAVLNSKGEPANFSKITMRITHGWNYSTNMRFWEGTPVKDADGYFYFDFASFKESGAPAGTDIYDYVKNTAKGISMLCYGGADENTCYYSAVELYRVKGEVRKNALKDAVRELESYGVVFYNDEIAAAKAVIDDNNATQEDVDAQLAIIDACIKAYKTAMSTGYTYVQLDGIQNWTEEEAAAMDGFGSSYSISDKGLVGDAKQSIKMTAKQNNTRFCFATRYANAGPFSTYNPYKVTNPADGKLSDYDGIAVAFADENGNEIEISQFTARLMRDIDDWNNYSSYQANYTDISACYANGYYHLKFEDYPALSKDDIDDVSIMSVLFYRDVKTGDTAYISDIKAYTYQEPEIVEYEYLQLNGVQNWTEEHLSKTSANNGHANSVTATYSLSDEWLVGAAAQSIKAVKSAASAEFNCLVNKAYDSNGIAAPSPWAATDGVSKVSDYDGVMIAVKDQDGNAPNASLVRLRVLQDPASGGWGVYQESRVYEINDEGYMVFKFSDFPTESAVRAIIDDAQGISFLLNDAGQTTYYFSDFKAFRIKKNVDFSKLEQAIATMKANNAGGKYDQEIAAAEAVLNSKETTQVEVDAKVAELNTILREILVQPVEFDEDNIVLTFGAVSDIHIQSSVTDYATQKYTNALKKLKEFAGGKLDAITIAGDISNSTYNSGIGTAFKTVTDQELGEDANVFFVTGNHDAQDGQWSTLNQIYADLAKYTEDDLASSQHDRGNRHKVINGYHYLAVNMMDYWNAAEAKFDTRDLDWLGAELEAARAAAPGQPIFVYVHAGVYGTTYGSDLYTGTYWGSKAIYSYLEDYPEVVTFSGHVHFPLADERTIYQKDFTSLNCGSVQYMAIENGYLQSGSKTTVSNSNQVSSGLLVQVDKNNNLKVTRLDFANGKIIKEPFYISAPDLENESNLLHYNDDYFNLDNTAPVFGADADVFGVQYGANMEVTFPAAADNDMVHHYVIELKGLTSGVKKTTKAFSEFYLYPTAEDFPDEYTFSIPYTPGTEGEVVEITVWAVDSMGLKSQPIVYNPSLIEPPVIVTQPADASAHRGEEVSVSVAATGKGLTYKWYYRNKGASSFIRALGYADATYSVEMDDNIDGREVYCKVVDKYGNEIQSEVATLTMLPDPEPPVDPVKIVEQPDPILSCTPGGSILVTFKAEGEELTYAWYYKNANETTFNKSSVTTAHYAVNNMNSKSDNRQVYCVVTDKYGNEARTITVTLRNSLPLEVFENVNKSTILYAEEGDSVSVRTNAHGGGLKYTWYVKNAGAKKFSKSSVTSWDYCIEKMSSAAHNRQVYCVITDRYGDSYTTKIYTIRRQVTITKEPSSDAYAQNGKKASIKFTAVGDDLKYTWYVKNNGASKYSKSSITSATYSATVNSSSKDRKVYCVVTDKYGNTDRSRTYTLRMAATITKEPAKINYAQNGKKISVKVTTAGDSLKYTWYVKNSGAKKYSKSSVKTATYSVTMSDSVKGRQVYCVVKDKYGKTVTSKTFTLRMSATITTQPKTVTVKKNATAKLTVKAKGDGLKYTWYVKNEGAKKYSKSSVTKSTYSVKMTSKVKNRTVYVVVTDKYGKKVTSKTVKLKMK